MNNLKKLRKIKGLTQTEVAQFIGITQNSYSYWENDKVKIDNASIIKLADFFGVTVDFLLGREEFSSTEKAGGLSETRRMVVNPIEEDLIFAFRQFAKTHSEDAQRAIVTMIEKMG